jgi:hypothetical protein
MGDYQVSGRVGGVAVTVQTRDAGLLPALEGLAWRVVDALPEPPAATVELYPLAPEDLARYTLDPTAEYHFQSPPAVDLGFPLEVRVGIDQGTTTILYPTAGVATADRDWRRLRVGLACASAEEPGPQLLLMLLFIDLAADHGAFTLHASVAEKDAGAVLLVGPSGSGKSTSCLALGRAGWTLVCDDHAYVRPRPSPLTIWGAAGEMRLRENTADLWPDMTEAVREGRHSYGKRHVRPAALGLASRPGSSLPRALFFPRVTGGAGPRLESMPAAQALQELLLATGVALCPAHTAAHFSALADLAQCAPAFRLELGARMEDLPALVESVLS